MHDVAEAALIGQHALEPIEIAAGALLDQRPPQIDQLARGGGRRFAGEPLAHHHGQRVLDRRIGAVGDLVEFAAVETVVEHGGEILGDAAHAARADRLDAGLLDGLEHRARLLAAGRQLAMHRRIVTGEPQRDRIGVAAHDRRLALVEPARRLRQPRLAAGKPRPLGRERHFEIALAGDRRRQTPTARLNGSVGASLAGLLGLMFEDMSLIASPRRQRRDGRQRYQLERDVDRDSPAAPGRSSADRTRRPAAAPARRIC